MGIPETWKNYQKINRMVLDGVSFVDIATRFDDSEDHIKEFWSRYREQKAARKRQWDLDNKEHVKEWTKQYRREHRDEINSRERSHRAANPDKYKEYYYRKRKRAELEGRQLNDPEYHKAYREAHKERLREQSKEYYIANRDKIIDYQKHYYEQNREKILEYHVEYQTKNKRRRIERLISNGSLPDDWDEDSSMSSYEFAVKYYLDDIGVKYKREKTFKDCVDKSRLRFDFFLTEIGALIEVDGQQHFDPTAFGHDTGCYDGYSYETIVAHDTIKTKYCEKNNIPLLRIPYYAFDDGSWKEMIRGFIHFENGGVGEY